MIVKGIFNFKRVYFTQLDQPSKISIGELTCVVTPTNQN